MPEGLSIEELASGSDESLDDVRRWQQVGLLGEEPFSVSDVERVRLTRALEDRGLSLATITSALRDHRPAIDDLIEQLVVPTATQAASVQEGDEIDLDRAVFQRIATAGGFDDVLRAPTPDDLVALKLVHTALGAGIPEAALLQLVRVYDDAFARIADTEVRLFHMYVHQALRASGLSGQELTDATHAIGDNVNGLIEPSLLYFHRRAWTKALRADLVIHVLEELGLEETEATDGRLSRAVLFVDLSSFTPLTSVMGDAIAAAILDRFSILVRSVARRSSGSTVKQMGDGFMLVFVDAGAAVRTALELKRRLSEESQFPAMHAAVHHGPLLYRDGDYVGTTVNVAARLLGEAGRNEIVVSASARREAGALVDASFTPLSMRTVKGIVEPLELFNVEARDHEPPRRRVDPICGMQLRDDEIAARMTLGNDEHVFCSETCLDLFVSQRSGAHLQAPGGGL